MIRTVETGGGMVFRQSDRNSARYQLAIIPRLHSRTKAECVRVALRPPWE